MKKYLVLVAFAATLFFSVSSCKRNIVRGKGEVTTTNRVTNSFSRIDVSVPVDIDITVNPNANSLVDITTHQNLHDYIKTEVVNNTLRIYSDDLVYSNEEITVTVSTASLQMLDISGAADATINGNIQEDKFQLDVSGAAEVDIEEMNTDAFVANLSGASELTIRGGNATHVEFDVNGAGEVDAMELKSKTVIAEVSGAGEMSLNVSDKLSADITGAGSIDYKGHPKITSDITGAGSLNDRN